MSNNSLFLPFGENRVVTVHFAGNADTASPRLHTKDSHFLFEYVLSGEECIESPDYLTHAGIGDLVIIHPFEECVLYRNNGTLSVLSFQVSGFILEAMWDVLGFSKVMVFSAQVLDKMLSAAALFENYSAGDGDSGRKLCEVVFSLMLDAAEYKENTHFNGKPNAGKIRDYLDLCLCGDVDLDAVGKKFGITGMHVIRLFRAEYDETPMQYLKIKRLEKSAKLLTESDMSIKDISALLRFSSTQHFTNLFREHFGISPGKYRES